jgi:NodT family efflux transporter outer membrane factor (OMF) lipoprotein
MSPLGLRLIAPMAGLAALSGCTVGPDYHAPSEDMPASFARPSPVQLDAAGLARWWTGWQDPALDRLIARGIAGNLDIAQAASRVRQARWQMVIAGAADQPQLSFEGNASHTHLSRNSQIGAIASQLESNGGPGGLAGAGIPGTTFASFRTGFDASWEIDLFGGTRRAVEAARGRAEASEWSRRDAEVLVAAEIADGYFHFRALQRRLGIADANIASRRGRLASIAARQQAGLVSTLDLRAEQGEIAAATADRATLLADKEAQLHALAVLVGGMPEALAPELEASPPALAVRPVASPGLPAELLRRRPDVRAAERRLAAASADIGVAAADRLPRLQLSGALELVSSGLGRLVEGDSVQSNVAAGLSAPLLDGGRLRATERQRQEAYREAELAYRKTVLTALRDTEDALSRQAADKDRLGALAAADAAARDAFDTARVKHRAGLIGDVDVAEAETASLTAADQLATAHAAVDRDLVALYKALGGGWSEPQAAGEPAK